MKKYDLILIHAPSIYDFRGRDDVLFAFSSSSSISVSPIYEMYPLGLKTIETFLKQQGKKVAIINLADMMLKNPELNVESLLQSLNARMFGIDLHWLAHTQGSLAVAKVLKEYHPNIPVIFGGISASYFYNELMEYPQVDFIIRGVDTPYLINDLLNQLGNGDYSDILNLCWRDKDNNIVANTFSNTSEFKSSVDWVHSDKDINYYMVFSGAGCEYNCTFCSGAKYSMNKYMGVKNGFANKEVKNFLKEIESITRHSSKNSTIITLHHWFEDINLLEKVLDTIKSGKIKTLHFTLFELLPKEHINLITKYNVIPFFEVSLQSSSERIRRLCGNPSYSNDEVEEWLDYLFKQNKKAVVGFFFMIGLPEQAEKDVLEDVAYAEYLMRKYQKYDLNIYISPMRPFLDPGSIIFDNPDKFGYKILFNSICDYEKALLVPHWKDSLNYETQWMSKKQIVDVNYKATRALILAKCRTHKIPEALANLLIEKIDSTVRLLDLIESYDNTLLPPDVRKKILEYNNEIFKSNTSQQNPFSFRFYKYWYEI